MVLSWRNGKMLVISSDHLVRSVAIRISVRGVQSLSNTLICVNTHYLGLLLSFLVRGLVGRLFGWFNYFLVVGYNYNVLAGKGRLLLLFYVSLVYRVVIKLPVMVRVFVGKRRLFVVGSNLLVLK